jgi:universal stress protein A
MRILLAVDGSAPSDAAVRVVARSPWPEDAMVRVLAVAVPVAPASELAFAVPELEHDAEQEANRAADAASRLLAASGLSVETKVRLGPAPDEILDEAREWPADLVVVGSHGRTGVRRLILGSVAEYVVRHAPCSVMVARSKE